MAEPKTKATNQNVEEFLNRVIPEQKRKDSFKLLELYKKVTNKKPVMWGSSIIGFGEEGGWPLAAFSPRKQSLTLYVMSEAVDFGDLFKKLGKHKTSKACLYINKLSDIDIEILAKIVKMSFEQSKKIHRR